MLALDARRVEPFQVRFQLPEKRVLAASGRAVIMDLGFSSQGRDGSFEVSLDLAVKANYSVHALIFEHAAITREDPSGIFALGSLSIMLQQLMNDPHMQLDSYIPNFQRITMHNMILVKDESFDRFVEGLDDRRFGTVSKALDIKKRTKKLGGVYHGIVEQEYFEDLFAGSTTQRLHVAVVSCPNEAEKKTADKHHFACAWYGHSPPSDLA